MKLNLKRNLNKFLQYFYSECLTVLARARMNVIQDSGTAIGFRATLFNEVIPQSGTGAELGVYKGTLSSYILNVNHPRKLHLVDPWWKYKADWGWAIGDTSSIRSLGALLIVLKEYIASGQVQIHIEDSVSVLKSFEDNYLDWAYIDSTHSYKQTKAELALLKEKVNDTGIIAGDDWQKDPEHKHHGVYKAVMEFLSENPSYTLIYNEGTQWAISIKSKI